MSKLAGVRLRRPLKSVVVHAVAALSFWLAHVVAGVYFTAADGWVGLVYLVPALLILFYVAYTVFGSVRVDGATYQYRFLFVVRRVEFQSTDALSSGRKIYDKSMPWPGWLGYERQRRPNEFRAVHPLLGAVFLPDEVRHQWASVIVTECARAGLDLQYVPRESLGGSAKSRR